LQDWVIKFKEESLGPNNAIRDREIPRALPNLNTVVMSILLPDQ